MVRRQKKVRDEMKAHLMIAGTPCCAREVAGGILVLLRGRRPSNMLRLFSGLSRVCVRLLFVSDWPVVSVDL